METLFQKQQTLLAGTVLSFKRCMYDNFPWESPMAGFAGPRGMGITTMLLHFIKEKTAREQIKNTDNAYIVKDNIEYGYKNVIPLWAFGLNY